MKKYILFVSLLVSINTIANNAIYRERMQLPPDTTVLPSILSINLSYYIGKPVDSLLSVLPAGFSNRGFMPVGAGYAKGIYQSYSTSYSNNCFVEIFIDTFQFLSIPNRTQTSTWNMNLAKQETISKTGKYWNKRKGTAGEDVPATRAAKPRGKRAATRRPLRGRSTSSSSLRGDSSPSPPDQKRKFEVPAGAARCARPRPSPAIPRQPWR